MSKQKALGKGLNGKMPRKLNQSIGSGRHLWISIQRFDDDILFLEDLWNDAKGSCSTCVVSPIDFTIALESNEKGGPS